jgi:hypothetical protein
MSQNDSGAGGCYVCGTQSATLANYGPVPLCIDCAKLLAKRRPPR